MVTVMNPRPQFPEPHLPEHHYPHDLPVLPAHRVTNRRYGDGTDGSPFAWKVFCSGCRSWYLGDGQFVGAVRMAHHHVETGKWSYI